MKNLSILDKGQFTYDENGRKFHANFPLFLIRRAWNTGCDFEKEADGFGEGMGTCEDWSGIRDSSPRAIEHMLEKALNFLFEDEKLKNLLEAAGKLVDFFYADGKGGGGWSGHKRFEDTSVASKILGAVAPVMQALRTFKDAKKYSKK